MGVLLEIAPQGVADVTTLVVGATGATGRLLVRQLLARGQNVRAVARSPERLPEDLRIHERLALIHAVISELDDAEMARHVRECDAVASCLGHSLSFAGVFGPPHRLVTDATRRLCRAIRANPAERPTKFVLMNTAGNRNRDRQERVSLPETLVLRILRLLVPPHADNEGAADYLRVEIGQDDGAIEWCAVRPDTLIDENDPTEYEVHPSPIRGALFDPGKTSRINVAHFMAELIENDRLWSRWKGQMPVIYNTARMIK